ncbi:hypothetical protein CASFOL_037191 [Castilleja foliolosa]|uniref:Uncharacterized protein n=1 Tax=Castilleja foliolosa TaxID=1961234 RepID=A0ABD3BP27_9LAMI
MNDESPMKVWDLMCVLADIGMRRGCPFLNGSGLRFPGLSRFQRLGSKCYGVRL